MEPIHPLEERVAALEAWATDVKILVAELRELNSAVRDMAAALRVLSRLGGAVKWVAGVAAAVSAMVYGIKHWLLGGGAS